MKIIGISGKAGSGKDWLAALLGRCAGYKKWSFALPMKAAGHGMGFTIEEVDVTKPPHVRDWLQRYGTEEHRDKYRPDFWLRSASYFVRFLEAQGFADKLVFPDVRFPNEVEWVQAQGGKVVRLWHDAPLLASQARPFPLAGTTASYHQSEVALDSFGGFDLEIVNDLTMHGPKALRLLVSAGVVSRDELTPLGRQSLLSEEGRYAGNYRLGPGGTKERGVLLPGRD